MGICHSSAAQVREESDGSTVYVVEDEGLCPPGGIRKVASLYSRQGKKGPNQDAAILCQGYGTDDGVFAGVFDGHGRRGHVVSRLVRDRLPSLLLSQRNALLLSADDARTPDDFAACYDDDDDDDSSVDSDDDFSASSSSPEMFDEWKEACIGAFRAMDKDLRQRPAELDCSDSGTTAVTVVKQGRDLIISNLGDSRAVLGALNDDGDLVSVQLTTDLKPGLPHELERIRKNNGRVFALRGEPNTQRVWLPNDNYPGLAMARAFGDFQLKRYGVIAIPQVSYRRVQPNDLFIVLATDGVWDVLSNDEVVKIVWSARSKEVAAKAVVAAAVRAWKRKFPSSKVDDCSAVCLCLQEVEEFEVEEEDNQITSRW